MVDKLTDWIFTDLDGAIKLNETILNDPKFIISNKAVSSYYKLNQAGVPILTKILNKAPNLVKNETELSTEKTTSTTVITGGSRNLTVPNQNDLTGNKINTCHYLQNAGRILSPAATELACPCPLAAISRWTVPTQKTRKTVLVPIISKRSI